MAPNYLKQGLWKHVPASLARLLLRLRMTPHGLNQCVSLSLCQMQLTPHCAAPTERYGSSRITVAHGQGRRTNIVPAGPLFTTVQSRLFQNGCKIPLVQCARIKQCPSKGQAERQEDPQLLQPFDMSSKHRTGQDIGSRTLSAAIPREVQQLWRDNQLPPPTRTQARTCHHLDRS